MTLIIRKVVSILILGLVFLVVAVTATPYITSTGNLGDWGLSQLNDPSADWSVNETWIPFDAISYMVEDNYNPKSGSSYNGVHIKGTGSLFNFFDEPQVNHAGMLVWEPYGNELFDLEALYFAQDDSNIFVAIITSVAQEGNPPQPGGDRWPGDLALNFGVMPGEEFDCEYGVKLNLPTNGGNYQVGDIVKLPHWQGIGYITPAGPDIILGHNDGGGVVGHAIVHYNMLDVPDRGYPNYFIEVTIPKSEVGVTGSVGFQSIKYYDNCLNDHLYIPEFPAFSILLGMLFGIAGIVFITKSKKE